MAQSSGGSRSLRDFLGKRWWAGLGVLVAVAGIVLGLTFSSGGSSNISNTNTNVNCNVVGNGNTACPNPGAKPSP